MCCMKKIKHIFLCSDQYPTRNDPVYPFVEQITVAFARMGINVSVVAPQSLTKHWTRKTPLHPVSRVIEGVFPGKIEIYQPRILSFGSRLKKINFLLKKMAVKNIYRHLTTKPDVCYGHFWHSAYALFDIAKKENIPLFVACGEADVLAENSLLYNRNKDFFDYVKGIFCVSKKNKRESLILGYKKESNCVVLPNAIDESLFFRKEGCLLRQRYGFSDLDFIVVFVGSFINRKGPLRVAEALKKLNNERIKAFFIGKEQDSVGQDPVCPGILYKGVVEHEKLVDYLNMADVFVLPTLAEGCCNAIVEAMACGLPIISSNLPFNDDILDDTNSIRINPNSVDEIAAAILKIKRDKTLCEQMGQASLRKAQNLTIDVRARKILEFIDTARNEGG